MQLNTMDCRSRSNNVERDSDLGDDLSNDIHSDDDMRDCDSLDEDHVHSRRLSSALTSNGGMNFSGGGGGGGGGGARSPDNHSDMQMGHHHQFPPNHPLNALGNFMGIGGLHGIPNLQHNDVLEKLKMQVRDMKVGLMDQDYAAAHAAAFSANVLPSPMNTAFSIPPTSMAPFGHSGQSLQGGSGGIANGDGRSQSSAGNTATSAASGGMTNGGGGVGGSNNGSFSFTSPTAPNTKDVNPASNSSTSSEASNSSQQNNGWSFEEQYKQVRQLYEINNDPKRKEFLDDLFSFMQKRGSPINRLPIMAKSVLDLYELYNLVIARGGLVDVINKKLWQEIIKGLNLPSSITSAAFTLRTQYMKYLYPYECEKKNLSTPAELQAAIDGNRREGRRSSYGQYEAMHSQMQMPQMSRQSMQQMSPLALVTNNQQAQAAAAAAAVAHHRMLAPTFGQVPNLVSHEIEQRMMEYLKMIQVKKEQCAAVNAGGVVGGGAGSMSAPHQQQQRHRSQSPEISTRDALNTLEMSRLALWQMYHNNTSPPASVNTSPQGGLGVGCSISATSGVGGGGGGGGGSERGGGSSSGGNGVEPQREALNLSDSPPIKREREREPSQERDDFMHQPPPTKRSNSGFPVSGFPVNFYLPTAAGAAANFHHPTHDSDMENEEENEDDGEHNTTTNSSNHEHDEESDVRQQQVNGHLSHHHHHQHQPHHQQHHLNNNRRHLRSSNGSGHHDKSDDSAIENSPSTSTSAGNGHISPVSTKKIHLVKPHNSGSSSASGGNHGQHDDEDAALGSSTSIGPLETLSLLSSMQFRVTRNGTGTNGEQQLIVNLELNGIRYSGMLVANTTATTVTGAGVVATTKRTLSARVTPTATTTAAATAGVAHKSTSNSNNNSKKHEVSNSTDEDNEDDLMETEATSEQDADEETDTTNAATMLAAVAAAATASAVGSDISPKATKCESTTGAPLANGPSSNAALKDTLITTATT